MFNSLKFKKLTGFFVALLMTISILAPMASTNVKAAEAGKTFDIVEITDFHGALLDTSNNQVGAVLADRIKKVQKANPDTIVIGGGDLYQGSAVSNMLQGVPVQKVLSNIGMEVTTVGNHEFDWGLKTIIDKTMNGASYSMISANLYDKATNKRVFDPYKIVEKDGVKIAFIGAITEETPTIVLPAYLADYKLTDAATEINSVAKEIKDAKLADVIIALVHAGSYDTKTGEVFVMASKLQNVDAIFGGHSHTTVTATAANGLPIYIANNAGKGFIDAKMTVGADGKVSFPAPSAADYKALDNADGYKTATPVVDSEVKAIIDEANKQVLPITSEKLGYTDKALTRTQDGKPFGTSFLGNWSADATRNEVGADVGLSNNGGLRTDIPAGDITVGTMWTIMPFDNTIYKYPMTKAQLKAALENAFADGGKGIQISGIKVTYDSSKKSGSRVVDITRENGTPISDTEKLVVAANNFMATGGDGFTALNDAGGKDTANDTHVLVRDAFIHDVKAHGGIVTSTDSRIINKVANTVSVVATSDLHGNIYPWDYNAAKASNVGLAKVSTFVKNLKSSNPNVMLVDDGDTIQGTPLSYYYDMIDKTSEYPMMKVMGAMGYDTWTLGNHEFNYGLDTLNRVIADAKKEGIHVLSANTYNTKDNTNYVEPYFIKSYNVNGKTVKVGILGLTTKTIPSWEDPAHYAGLQFNDLVEEAQKWVPKVRAAGADIVIVAAHSGEEGAADVIPENEIKAIATKVSGIDAILAGHAHSKIAQDVFVNPDGKNVIVTEPGKWAQNVSQIDINFDKDGNYLGVSSKVVAMDDTIAADKNITDVVAKSYQDATLAYVKTKLGSSTGEFTGQGQLTQPTAIMDLINKVQMAGAKTQLSIAAPLSSSAYIPKGDITIQDIMSVYVYENFMFGVKMTGKQIKNWMEWSVRYYKQVNDPTDPIEKDPVLNIADYNLDQLYGATYDIDLTQPTGQRIKNLKYNGKPIKDTDVFTVAINNYRYNGGGGFMAAAGLSSTDPSIVTYDSLKALGDDGQVRSMMNKYIQDNKTISPTVGNNFKIYTTPVTEGSAPVVVQPTTPTVPAQPTSKVVVYVVKPGDVLWRIAKQYGLTYKQIGEYNKLKSFNLIFPGQKLLIPVAN